MWNDSRSIKNYAKLLQQTILAQLTIKNKNHSSIVINNVNEPKLDG